MLLWFGLLLGCPSDDIFLDDLVFFDSGGFSGEQDCFGDVSDMEPTGGTAGHPSVPYIAAEVYNTGLHSFQLTGLEPVEGRMVRPEEDRGTVRFLPDAPLQSNTPYTATVTLDWCTASWTFMVGRYNEVVQDAALYEQRTWLLPSQGRTSEMTQGAYSTIGSRVPQLVQPVAGAQTPMLRFANGDATTGQDLCQPTHDVPVEASNPWYRVTEGGSEWAVAKDGMRHRVEALQLGLRYDGSDAEMPEYRVTFDGSGIEGFCDEHFGCEPCGHDPENASCMVYDLGYGTAVPIEGALVQRTPDQIAADPACTPPSE